MYIYNNLLLELIKNISNHRKVYRKERKNSKTTLVILKVPRSNRACSLNHSIVNNAKFADSGD